MFEETRNALPILQDVVRGLREELRHTHAVVQHHVHLLVRRKHADGDYAISEVYVRNDDLEWLTENREYPGRFSFSIFMKRPLTKDEKKLAHFEDEQWGFVTMRNPSMPETTGFGPDDVAHAVRLALGAFDGEAIKEHESGRLSKDPPFVIEE